jgi:hypothetical protein
LRPLFRPAQNPNITIKDFASASNHYDAIQSSQPINWCIDQFINAVDLINPKKCVMGHDKTKGENGYLFDDFGTYYLSYFNAGSNNDVLSNFFPFPFTGLGVTYDPYYQARLEGASTEGDLNEILPNLIGTSEFIYAIPENGKSKTARMYLDEVYPIINTVPGPLPILGVGAGFAFTRRLRLRLRIRQGGRVTPQG